jgi:hypothetical protein
VSQALIIALSVILNDLLYLPWPLDFRIPLHLLGAEVEVGGVWSAGMAYGSRELVERHLFSLYFMLPLVAVCAGFMYHNWWVCKHAQPSHLTEDGQVSCEGISGRYAMLCHRHGVCGGWYSGTLFQDSLALFHPSNIQLCTLMPATFWSCAVSAASCSQVRVSLSQLPSR